MRTGLRVSDVGSPPRMRGKARTLRTGRRSRGITPAYAGKSTGGTHAHKCARDHPRVCGEKRQLRRCPFRFRGSPPRMRGKAGRSFAVCCSAGITPAYAGKSVISGSLWLSSRDHPRVCGEKWVPVVSSVSVQGSPPRMRGKVMQQCVARKVVGITPAYAGKSDRTFSTDALT